MNTESDSQTVEEMIEQLENKWVAVNIHYAFRPKINGEYRDEWYKVSNGKDHWNYKEHKETFGLTLREALENAINGEYVDPYEYYEEQQ